MITLRGSSLICSGWNCRETAASSRLAGALKLLWCVTARSAEGAAWTAACPWPMGMNAAKARHAARPHRARRSPHAPDARSARRHPFVRPRPSPYWTCTHTHACTHAGKRAGKRRACDNNTAAPTSRARQARGDASRSAPSPSAGSAPPPASAASVQEPSTSTAPAMSPAGPSQSSAVIDLTGDTPPASQPGPSVQEEDDGARFQRNREAREARYHYCVGDGAYQSGGASRQTHRLDTPPGNPLSLGSRLAEVSASTSANAEPGAGSGEQHGQAGPREEE